MSKAQKVEPFADLETAPVLRKQRIFEAGQMKLLALHLISFAPKYGYDLIKEGNAGAALEGKKSSGGVSKSMLTLNEAIIDVKKG